MMLRYAFDLGTSSVGWAVYRLDDSTPPKPSELLGTGVRIFPDGREPAAEGRTGESLAKGRRDARSPRRRRDRFVQRRTYLLQLLIEYGLLPSDEAKRKALVNVDPYKIREMALTKAVPLEHFGRAIFHINQRRGFKSNRKTDEPDEKGKIASGADRLVEKLTKDKLETLGAFYAKRQSHSEVRKRLPVRTRLSGDGVSALYDYYPLRQMFEDEFDLLWKSQESLHEKFPDADARDKIRHAIFYQRPLKPVEAGRCSYFPEEPRLPRAHPLTQERIIYETLNKIRLEEAPGQERALSLKERDKLAGSLLEGSDLTWPGMRKKLKLSSSVRINIEEGGEKKINGDALARVIKGTPKKPGPLAEIWKDCDLDQRIEIVTQLLEAQEADDLKEWFVSKLGLEEAVALEATKIRLPQEHGRIGLTATKRILEKLKEQVVVYSEASKLAGLPHHSDKRDGEVFDLLPKYNSIDELQRHIGFGTGDPDDPDDKRYGRVANPSVHVGLNQLRRVINALIRKYGRPDEIALELTRDLKQSAKQKEEEAKRNRENRAANERRRRELLDEGKIDEGDRRIGEFLMRMKLWEELGNSPVDRKCPYTGEQINLKKLISDDVEIEHILPRSRTLDDSPANKTVAMRSANRFKRNLSPAEAAERYPDKFNLDDILARTATMPPNKRWRFKPDAMDRFRSENSFVDRQLNETRHFSRLARAYVSKLSPGSKEKEHIKVWVTTGRLTSELRRKWGLHLPGHNRKNRNDFRHHAQDACVIGVIDQAMVQMLATVAAQDEEAGVQRILADIPEPYSGFTEQVNELSRKIIVSHRPDHSPSGNLGTRTTSGQLHEDTSYGLLRENADNKNRGDLDIGNVVRRKLVESLTEKEISQVRDLTIRAKLQQVLAEIKEDFPEKKDFAKQLPVALAQWADANKVFRVRTLKRESDIVPIISRQTGEAYRYVTPGENHHMDIIELPDGSWQGVAVSVFEVNQKDYTGEGWRKTYPAAKFIMRLHKTDTLQLFDADGENRIKRVVQIAPSSNRLHLAEHKESGELQKRHDNKEDEFRWDFANIGKLKARCARRVRVDEIGRVRTVPIGD